MATVTPAMYNNQKIEMRFQLPINFPIDQAGNSIESEIKKPKKDLKVVVLEDKNPSLFKEHRSQLNIPFTHLKYSEYEYQISKASNTHTAVKPYSYSYVNNYVDLDGEKSKFLKPEKKSWFGKKLWNEHLLSVEGDGYWFNLDFLVDVQLGKANRTPSYT